MKLIDKNLYADDGKWLYQDDGENRNFWLSITLANVDNAKYYSECTNEEKLAWEDAHKVVDEPDKNPS